MAQSSLSPRAIHEYEHLGVSRGCKNHDHDLIHELSRRLDGVWRYDQYLANAQECTDLQAFWRSIIQQEQDNIQQLKNFIKQHVADKCF